MLRTYIAYIITYISVRAFVFELQFELQFYYLPPLYRLIVDESLFGSLTHFYLSNKTFGLSQITTFVRRMFCGQPGHSRDMQQHPIDIDGYLGCIMKCLYLFRAM